VLIISIVAVVMVGVMVPSVFADNMFKNSRNDPANSYMNNDYGFAITPPSSWSVVENYGTAMDEGSSIVQFSNLASSDTYYANFIIVSENFDASILSDFAMLSNSGLREMGQLMAEEMLYSLNNPKITNVSLKNYSDGVLLDATFIHSVELSELTGDTWDDGTYVSLKRNSVMHFMDDGNLLSINFAALAKEFSLNHSSFKTSLKSFVISEYTTSNNWIESLSSQSEITSSTSQVNCGPGTESVNGVCQVVQTEEKSSKGGGCLIATATYGSELAPQVQQLRELRDNQLLNTESGTQFMSTFNDIYYSFSPTIADMERESPIFKEIVKLAITPMISSLSLMENVETESEVLGMGLSVIVLNIGMYLGVPAIIIVGIKRKF
jgi:hypothetical protein